MPAVLEAKTHDASFLSGIASHRDEIESSLLPWGALLLRGLGIASVGELAAVIESLSGPLLEYSYGSTPRSRVQGRIFTSTDYPPREPIPLHNEMAYARSWPRKLWLYCLEAPTHGGATPLADSRAVYRRIPPTIRSRFEQRGVAYVRNYGTGLDLPWQATFQTDDREKVERICTELGIEFTWGEHDKLATRQVCPSVVSHPSTGEKVWFNQAHLFHISRCGGDVQEFLQAHYRSRDLPRNAYYGDGAEIEPAALEQIRAAYEAETRRFVWHRGDLLLLDNVLIAHGRDPFLGPRRIVVAMTEPHGFPVPEGSPSDPESCPDQSEEGDEGWRRRST